MSIFTLEILLTLCVMFLVTSFFQCLSDLSNTSFEDFDILLYLTASGFLAYNLIPFGVLL